MGVCGQNSCYHVAAFDMQHDHVLKKLNFDLLTLPSMSTQWVRHRAFDRKSRLICFIFIVPLSACEISVKILTTDSYCEI